MRVATVGASTARAVRIPLSPGLILAALITLGVPTAAVGQDSVELWGAWGDWSGENAAAFDPGYALGASYVADVGVPLDIGVDVVFARFDDTGIDHVVDEFQASLVLRRWLLGESARVRPFLGGRVGYTRLSLDLADLAFEQNGVLAGPVLGLLLPTGKTLSPYLALEAMRHDYADTTLFLEDLELPQSGGAAWRFFVRVGVAFGSGWERR